MHNYANIPEGTDNHIEEMTWSTDTGNVSAQQLFLEATYNAKEIIRRIYIRFIRCDRNGNMFTVLNIDKLTRHHLIEIRHRKFGRCYSFHPDDRLQQLGIYYIKLE